MFGLLCFKLYLELCKEPGPAFLSLLEETLDPKEVRYATRFAERVILFLRRRGKKYGKKALSVQ